MNESSKTRIAHLAGPTATIQNTPPLVTSNKARAKRGLPLLKDADGAPLRHDALRPQRLAAAVKVYVEQFSAHPLESDVAELYGSPPDIVVAHADRVSNRLHRNAVRGKFVRVQIDLILLNESSQARHLSDSFDAR